MKKLLFISFIILLLIAATGCKKSSDKGQVLKCGAQTYTDPKIMAQVVKLLVENKTDHTVKIIENIPASPQIMAVMDRKELDIATLYSGEVYNNHFDEEQVEYSTDPQKTIEQAQTLFAEKYDIKWYDSIGFSNQYSIAVKKEFAEKNNISTMSDLGKYAKNFIIGTDTAWIERANDGYQGYQEKYGYKFKEAKGMEVSLMYKGIANDKLDVVTAYTVDPQIVEYDLKLLEDDKEFFPPYDASLALRNEIIAKYPEVGEILDSIVGLISTEEMTNLIREVDINGQNPGDVARKFLEGKGVLITKR